MANKAKAGNRASRGALAVVRAGQPYDVLTCMEGAQEIRVSLSTFRELIRSNQIQHVRAGRRVIVTRLALQKFLDGEVPRAAKVTR